MFHSFRVICNNEYFIQFTLFFYSLCFVLLLIFMYLEHISDVFITIQCQKNSVWSFLTFIVFGVGNRNYFSHRFNG